ncbi:unnamed protein product [Owenia fusiformis]|uniref:Rho-GAP domain-containing protein n=1 Tax=Owenia fusiformis TaxID=6347 RepID=A0A8S4NBA6_OWEFU|nr:unnamed protein product [Owenia fusiformis]
MEGVTVEMNNSCSLIGQDGFDDPGGGYTRDHLMNAIDKVRKSPRKYENIGILDLGDQDINPESPTMLQNNQSPRVTTPGRSPYQNGQSPLSPSRVKRTDSYMLAMNEGLKSRQRVREKFRSAGHIDDIKESGNKSSSRSLKRNTNVKYLRAQSEGGQTVDQSIQNSFLNFLTKNNSPREESLSKKSPMKNSPLVSPRIFNNSLNLPKTSNLLDVPPRLPARRSSTGSAEVKQTGRKQFRDRINSTSSDHGPILELNDIPENDPPITHSAPPVTPKTLRRLKPNISKFTNSLGTLFRNRSNSTKSDSDISHYDNHCHSDDDDDDNDDVIDAVVDNDEDDYGFLTLSKPVTNDSSSAMNKSKSPNPTRRILPKKWRSKVAKSSPSLDTCLWSSEDNNTWSSVSGRTVVLTSTSLLALTELERLALTKIALAQLQALQLGCTITIPKDDEQKSEKRTTFSLKKRTQSAHLGGLIDNIKDNFTKDKSKQSKDGGPGLVFGISLAKCIANDITQRKRRSLSLKERRESIDTGQTPRRQKHNSESASSLENQSAKEKNAPSPGLKHVPFSLPSMKDMQKVADIDHSSLLEALSLSSSARIDSLKRERPSLTIPTTPHVPQFVKSCLNHIENYGLQTLGIFRVGSSKKRTKQLREEFDSGKDVKLNEEHNPHDIGALLKEYFRDLPEPLLTRELYPAFVSASRLDDNQCRKCLRCLVELLPVANRDTLHVLLKFLHKVNEHSSDHIDDTGQEVPGNKMGARNLATLFGPNICRKQKGGADKEFRVEGIEMATESKEIIQIVEHMILNIDELYEVPAETHNEILQYILESDPEAVDHLLKRKGSQIEVDLDTSSSMWEGSDSSSLPPSSPNPTDTMEFHLPTRGSEGSMTSLGSQKTNRPVFTLDRSPVAEVTVETPSLVVPSIDQSKHRLSTPEPGWLSGGSTPRTPSPTFGSHARSPSPRPSPLPSRSSRSPLPSPTPVRTRLGPKPPNLQILPDTMIDKRGLIGPGGHSPGPESMYPTPPSSASSTSSPKFRRKSNPHNFIQPTSSAQRPLGVGMLGRDPEWQQERWRHWEELTQGEEKLEQETLV